MAFLTKDQMKTHIPESIRNAITNKDDTIFQSAIDAAVNEAKGYCSVYDVDALFAMSPPDPTLHMYVKNIAKWHFINLANPNIDLEDAQARYDQAIRWLRDVQNGKTVMLNWPKASPADNATYFHAKSNPKRRNHFT